MILFSLGNYAKNMPIRGVGKLLNLGVPDACLPGNAALMRALPRSSAHCHRTSERGTISSLRSAGLRRALGVCKSNLLQTEVALVTRGAVVTRPAVDATARLKQLAPFDVKTD
jgi:hypothetical protein